MCVYVCTYYTYANPLIFIYDEFYIHRIIYFLYQHLKRKDVLYFVSYC